MQRFRYLAAAAVVTVLSACGGGSDGTGTGGSGAPVTTTVNILTSTSSVEVGSNLTLGLEVRDQTNAIIAGKTASWASSNTAAATVDPNTGVVHGVAVGTSTITATVDARTGQTTITVTPPPVVAITLNANSGSVVAGGTVAFSATPKDKNGAVVSGAGILWTSSNPRVATVDVNGLVTTRSAGSATITAASGTVTATATVTATIPPGLTAPAITSISPATLTPGVTMTINGTNLGASGQGTPYIANVQATIVSASPTQITATVPATLPCQSTGATAVEVTTLAGTASAQQTLQVAAQQTLAVGQSFLATASGNVSCNELPTNGTYLVSVFNAGKLLGQNAGVELKGSVGTVNANLVAASRSSLQPTVLAAPASGTTSPVSAAEQDRASQHLAMLAADGQLFKRLGRPSRSGVAHSVAVGTKTGTSNAAVPLTVGAAASMNFHYGSCNVNAAAKITTRVVYVGPKVVVLEDNAGALAGKIDADMIGLAQEFENVSYPILTQNFGDPLAYDPQTDNNGRIIMLFTPQVNSQAPNLLGFVSGCDLYDPSADPSVSASNKAEIFYARAVTDTVSTTNLNTRSQWKRNMPGTLIHETKHIISNAERFATPVLVNSFEETWLEEATAQLASEMYARAIHGNAWRGNASYFGTLDCEVRPTTSGCGGGIFVMGNQFGFLSDFLQSFESKTILSGQDDNDIYGSSWMFTRWLVDTYGGATEGTLIKAIVHNYNVTGVDNVTSVTGKTWPQLLSQFTLMLAADDLPNITTPDVEQSWNLPAVFAGYHQDFPSSDPAVPLTVRTATFGTTFTASNSALKGGGAMVLRINAATGTPLRQLLDLHDFAGPPLSASSNVGISVLRIQ